MAHPNEEVLQRGYEAFQAGDMDAVLALLSDDIVYHIGGSNQLTGDHSGHQQVLALFGKIAELTGGTVTIEVHDILANDTHGVVLVDGHGERDGQVYDVRQVHIWHLANGQATESWNFAENQAAFDRLFA